MNGAEGIIKVGEYMRTYDDIEYNYHEYPNNDVYITIGINIGVATRYFLIDGKQNYSNNLAFANIFADYLQLIMGDKIVVDVDRTITTITMMTKQSEWINDFVILLKGVFLNDMDEVQFDRACMMARAGFEKAYKNGEFRAIYKAYEYADTNKGYTLSKLIEDIQNISFRIFVEAKKYLIVASNMYIYVNGNLKDISDSDKDLVSEIIFKNEHTAYLGGRVIDQLLKEDAHLLELSRQDINMDILSFGFKENISILDKIIYLNIESDKISEDNKILHIDEFDSSLIIRTEEVKKNCNYFKRPVNKQQFEVAREKMIKKYSQWLERNPVRFNMKAVELMMERVAVTDLLEIVINLQYEDYVEIATKIRPKVSEAQIVMRRR